MGLCSIGWDYSCSLGEMRCTGGAWGSNSHERLPSLPLPSLPLHVAFSTPLPERFTSEHNTHTRPHLPFLLQMYASSYPYLPDWMAITNIATDIALKQRAQEAAASAAALAEAAAALTRAPADSVDTDP